MGAFNEFVIGRPAVFARFRGICRPNEALAVGRARRDHCANKRRRRMTFGSGEIDPSQSLGGGSPARSAPAPVNKSPSAAANSTASSISTAARSPPANGAITPSTSSKTARCSRCSAAPRKSRSTASKRIPKLARRQGAYSVISATGLIVRRGHELDRVLRAIDVRCRWWRISSDSVQVDLRVTCRLGWTSLRRSCGERRPGPTRAASAACRASGRICSR